jgi:integrase
MSEDMKGIRKKRDKFIVDVTHAGKRLTAVVPTVEAAVIKRQELKLQLMKSQRTAQLVALGVRPEDADEGEPKVELQQRRHWTLQMAVDYTIQHVWSGTPGEQAALKNVRKVLRYFRGTTHLKNINTMSVDNFIESLKEDGLSNSSINRALSALSRCLSTAIERGGLSVRPHIRHMKEIQGRIRWLTEDEADKMRATFFHFGLALHGLAFDVLLETGFRPSELWTLEWHQVDFKRETITIWAENNKTNRNRTVGMTEPCALALKSIRVLVPDGIQVLPATDNYWFEEGFKRVAQHLQMDKLVVPYVLRHTCCSRLVQEGQGLPMVQAWMGHTAIQTTLRYAHLAPKNVTDMAKVLDKRRDVHIQESLLQ